MVALLSLLWMKFQLVAKTQHNIISFLRILLWTVQFIRSIILMRLRSAQLFCLYGLHTTACYYCFNEDELFPGHLVNLLNKTRSPLKKLSNKAQQKIGIIPKNGHAMWTPRHIVDFFVDVIYQVFQVEMFSFLFDLKRTRISISETSHLKWVYFEFHFILRKYTFIMDTYYFKLSE